MFTVVAHPSLPGRWLILGPNGRAVRRPRSNALRHYTDHDEAAHVAARLERQAKKGERCRNG